MPSSSRQPLDPLRVFGRVGPARQEHHPIRGIAVDSTEADPTRSSDAWFGWPAGRRLGRAGVDLESRGPHRQVTLLGQARRAVGCGTVVGCGPHSVLAGHFEQVSTYGVQAVLAGQPLVAPPCRTARPSSGPCTIAVATARLRVTTGLPLMRSSSSYSARICGQSVSSAVSRTVDHGRDRRLQLVLAGLSSTDLAVEQRRALGDPRLVPPAAVLLGHRDQIARPRRSGRAVGRP